MSPDHQLRALERAADAGDPVALQRLGEERCRRGLHDLPDGLVMWRQHADSPVYDLFRVCGRCATEVGVRDHVVPPEPRVDRGEEDHGRMETRDEARVRLRAHIDENTGPIVRDLRKSGWADLAAPRRAARGLPPFDAPRDFSLPETFRVRLVEFRCACGLRLATVHVEGEADPVPPSHLCGKRNPRR